MLFSCVVELLSSEWQKLLEQCQQVTDTIRIEVKKDAISFVYGGGKIEQRANADEDHKLAIVQHDCDVSVSFAMRHLILFTKVIFLTKKKLLRNTSVGDAPGTDGARELGRRDADTG